MRDFAKAKEWVAILNRLNILQPIGFPYTGELGAITPEYKRQLFDELNSHYNALLEIEKPLIYRNIKDELQSEFLAVITDLSVDNVTNTIEIIRRWFNLKIFEVDFKDCCFFKDLVNNGIATEDEILRLSIKIYSAIRFRNIVCKQIKEAYIGLMETQPPQPQQEVGELPDVLNTDEAKTLLDRLYKAGYCDSVYKWVNGTAYQAAQAAYNISVILWKCNKWKPFEIYWGLANMAQTFAKNRLEANQKDIDDIDSLYPENKPPEKELVKL